MGVFIPLLLLNAGAQLWQVPAFYVAYAIIKLLINFPIARYIVQLRGVHTAFAVGFGAAIVQFGCLHMFVNTQNQWWVLIAAAAMAVVNACMWIPQHLHISAIVESSTRSSSMATIETINQVLGVAAPLTGGIIGATFGPGWLIGVALAFLALAFLPLRFVGKLHDKHTKGRNDEPLRYSVKAAPRRDLFANFCWNVESSVGTLVWPIFLAVEIATYKSIGLIGTLAGLGTVVALWIAGRRGDKGNDRRVLGEAAAASSAINLLRLVSTASPWVTAVSIGYKSSLAYGQVAWVSSYYTHAQRKGPQWVMAMEIACDVAYLLLWSLLIVVALFADALWMFTTAFLIAAAGAWGCLALSCQPSAAEHQHQ